MTNVVPPVGSPTDAWRETTFRIDKEKGYDYLLGVMLQDLTQNLPSLNPPAFSAITKGIVTSDGAVLLEGVLADLLISTGPIPFGSKFLEINREVRGEYISMYLTALNIAHTDPIKLQLITLWGKEPKSSKMDSQNISFQVPSGITSYEYPVTIKPGYKNIVGVRVFSTLGSQHLDVGFVVENGSTIQEPIYYKSFFSSTDVPIKDRMMPWGIPVPKNRIKVFIRESFGAATTGVQNIAVEFILE